MFPVFEDLRHVDGFVCFYRERRSVQEMEWSSEEIYALGADINFYG